MQGLSGISRHHYEGIVAAVGTSDLGRTLLAAADVLCVDEIFAFASSRLHAPRPLASAGAHGAFSQRVRLYADKFHALDPLFQTLGHAEANAVDVDVVLRVRATDIVDADYRRECFDKPRLLEKFSLAQRRKGDWCVLSLYRREGREQASDERLLGFSHLIVPLMAKHAQLVADDSHSLLEKVERRIACEYPTLTGREQAVCARTLIGMTAEAIAIDLDIGQSTVLTYRRRAYERLNISAANQLIERLLR